MRVTVTGSQLSPISHPTGSPTPSENDPPIANAEPSGRLSSTGHFDTGPNTTYPTMLLTLFGPAPSSSGIGRRVAWIAARRAIRNELRFLALVPEPKRWAIGR